MIDYEPLGGDRITTTCHEMSKLAAESGDTVRAKFNGIEIIAEPGIAAQILEDTWLLKDGERRRAYEASPEGRKRKQEREAALRVIEEHEHEPLESFEISDADVWQRWCESNKEGYGRAILRFAARWANFMDAVLAKIPENERSVVLSDVRKLSRFGGIAEGCADQADDEGITGFMYGAAVKVLSECWKHGDSIRRWHNLNTQIGDEGEQANADGGTLNPALLCIGN